MTLSARRYFQLRSHHGRAVVRYRALPDEQGMAQPQLWLCEIGGQLFACDDGGPEDDSFSSVDYGYLNQVRDNAAMPDLFKAPGFE